MENISYDTYFFINKNIILHCTSEKHTDCIGNLITTFGGSDAC